MEKRTYPPRARRTARRLFAENLRIIRLQRQIPQEELADMAGMDRSYLGAVERGERNVCIDNIERLAQTLGVPIPYLLTEPDTQQLSPDRLADIRRRIKEEPAIYCVRR